MNKSSISKILEEIKEQGLESKAESLHSINIKPSNSSSALLETLSQIAHQTPSSFISNNLSYFIASTILEIAENENMLQEAISHVINEHGNFINDSAIGLIKQSGIAEITLDTGFDLKEIIKKK